MNFADRLDVALAAKGSPLCLGVDPHLDQLPPPFDRAADSALPRADRAELVRRFCCELLDLAADRVAIVKPQSAFFEVLGADGVRAFEEVVDHARSLGLLVLGDVKRGDIASTARAYAKAHLAPEGADASGRCDAITVSPYLGPDTLEPFLEVCKQEDAGLFCLVRTSNPQSDVWQGHGTPPLAECVAEQLERFAGDFVGECGLASVGAVTGATHPEALARWRSLLPRSFLLLPGYGAQGATAKDVVPAFLPGGRGALVASSRGISFAWKKPEHAGRDWKQASSDALDAARADLSGALG